MRELAIAKVDITKVYPQDDNKSPNNYFGKKWGVASYELNDGTRGVMDFPIPPECDDIQPVARRALNMAINRGTYNQERKVYEQNS